MEFEEFSGNHTGEAIRDKLYGCVKKFEIDQKIVAITTDNESANGAKMDDLRSMIGREGSGFIHVRCFAQILNLAVKNGIKTLIDYIKPIKTFVINTKSSTLRKDQFERIQSELLLDDEQCVLGFNKPLSLINEVDTRWNSTFFMIERFSLLRPAIEKSTAVQFDWNIITKLVEILEPFPYFSQNMSSEEAPTISYVVASADILYKHIRSYKGSNSKLDSMLSAIISKLDEYRKSLTNDSVLLASILDPRIKTNYIGDNLDRIKAQLRRIIGNQTESPSQTKRRSVLDEMFINTSQETDELTMYISGGREPKDVDILNYWRTNQLTYPKLSRVARSMLCIQSTSVSSERVFSQAGLVDTQKRSRLDCETFRSLILNKSWSRF